MKTWVCGIQRDLEAERIAYKFRCDQIRLAANHLREAEIMRVCAHFELESDEFLTREQKALAIIS